MESHNYRIEVWVNDGLNTGIPEQPSDIENGEHLVMCYLEVEPPQSSNRFYAKVENVSYSVIDPTTYKSLGSFGDGGNVTENRIAELMSIIGEAMFELNDLTTQSLTGHTR